MNYLGIVDVSIYRKIYCDSLESEHNNKIANKIEEALDDINEIMRSKVAAIHGNCILGYKIDITKIKDETSLMN